MLETLRALAEPTRLQIVDLLLREPLPVGVLAERLGIRQPQATKHLQTLSHCGLVEARHDAQRRVYSLRPQPLREIDAWLEPFRARWEEQFGRLDDVLAEIQAAGKPPKAKPKPKRRGR